MIAIIDYGAGNLFSVKNALDFLGIENVITGDANVIKSADRLILPGVGAFPDAMKKLNESRLVDVIKEETISKPLLGICLGMQMLFKKGYEFAETDGLGLIDGTVELMKPKNLLIPHIGWNNLEKNELSALTSFIENNSYVYFVHSYAANCDSKNVAFYADYGMKIPAMVFKNNVYGCQFHPEKSGKIGLSILEAFSKI